MESLPSSSGPTVGELVTRGEEALSRTSPSARLDAEVLLSHVMSLPRSALIARWRDACATGTATAFGALLERRGRGEPVAYLVGSREFYGRSFAVAPAVLIPRPESELIIDEALKACEGKGDVSIADLGTGSGCLAITIILELASRGTRAVAVATDVSAAALEVARRNAAALGAQRHITFATSDWLSAAGVFSPPYDLIVANPPYVSADEPVPVDLSFEPAGALFSADAGLADVKKVISQGVPMLKRGGILLCEVGAGKRAALGGFLPELGLDVSVSLLGDPSALDRFTVVRAERVA